MDKETDQERDAAAAASDPASPDLLGLVDPIGPRPSPFLPRNLMLLFRRPSEFFKSEFSLSHAPNVILVTWCVGMAAQLDSMRDPRLGGDWFDSWLTLWIWILIGGAINGVLYWWLGGWWFRLRIRWSGDRGVDRSAARLVMVYSAFVYAGPVVLLLMLQTLAYPSYALARANDPFTPLVLVIFSFWSVATSYIGVSSTFSVIPWKTKIWFLYLPLLLYAAMFGVVAWFFQFLAGQPPP